MSQITQQSAEQFHSCFTDKLETHLEKKNRLKQIEKRGSTCSYYNDIDSVEMYERYQNYERKRELINKSIDDAKKPQNIKKLKDDQACFRRLFLVKVALIVLGVVLLAFAAIVVIAVNVPALSAMIVTLLAGNYFGVSMGGCGLFIISSILGVLPILLATVKPVYGYNRLAEVTHHDWNVIKNHKLTLESRKAEDLELEEHMEYYKKLMEKNEGSFDKAVDRYYDCY